jgi:SAM-dependent methyltransferase
VGRVHELGERRRLSFGSVAEQYDRVRPIYPEQLVDDVIAYAGDGLAAAGRVLEVGAGTGKATLQFAARGLGIDAIEPDRAMAAVASQRAATAEVNVRVHFSDFESADLPEHAYWLLYAGQSWHWVAPERRYELAARALVPGGTLALFWNRPDWSRCELRAALDGAYRRSQVQMIGRGPQQPSAEPLDAEGEYWLQELAGTPAFTGAELRRYDWAKRYGAAEYIELVGTHSDHLLLDEGERRRLFAEITEVIGAAGGSFELTCGTLLCLARRRP